MWLHTWVTVVCLLVSAGPVISASFQQEYEWVHYGELAQYARDIAFSLVSFTIPPNTHKAEFSVMLMSDPTGDDKRKVLLSLRQAAIPVLQAYNETVPESYILPADQQIYEAENETNVTLTLNSPSPGRVYLVASDLNPLPDVIDYLRWGQKMEGGTMMSVMANYTLRTSMASLSVDEVIKISSAEGLTQIYSFRVPCFTMSYSVIISNCHHNNSSSNCPVTMMTADSLAVHDNSSVSVDCRQQGQQCRLPVQSPVLEQDHYITFSFHTTGKDQNTTFDVSFDVQGCRVEAVQYSGRSGRTGKDLVTMKYPGDQESTRYRFAPFRSPSSVRTKSVTPSAYRNLTGVHQLMPGQNPLCINLGYLGRSSHPSMDSSFSFSAEFGTWSSDSELIPDFDIIVPDFSTEVRTFSLQDSLDSGGTLYIKAELLSKDWQGVVWVCVMAHRLAMNGSVDKCSDGALLTLNATTTKKGDQHVSCQVYLPFPTSGAWYMAMQSQCRGAKPCDTLPKVQLSVRLEECAPNNCGHYGSCQVYTDANLVFAGCNCHAGYRGLLCNDDTHSLTDSEQLRAVYLLTLSNLAFLPAICLALYRGYFTLAAIFFYNTFFSAFYHACDTSQVFQTCILDYNTLAFCDFFGSVFSFFSVLLYMAKIPDRCRSFLLVTGALVIAVFLNSDRHNDVAHIMPLAVAGCILIISWVMVMWKRRKLYPSRRRYLFFLLPGMLLAVTGIAVNYGFMWHQSTYQYTHSFWHVSLMVSPCFLMPPRSKRGSGSRIGLSISAQDIIRSGNHRQTERLLGPHDDDEPAMFDASFNSISTDQNQLI